ncbi:MAG: C40 family peptidase [Bacteroidia bacterium]|nr:C40 family peptidase [Bacteroidia bacterium]
MIKRILLCLLLILSFPSCKSKKQIITKKSETLKTKKTKSSGVKSEDINLRDAAQNIIDYANSFKGVRYKFGGTNRKGMDCSGLVYTAFKKENVLLPRISRDMAKKGKRISLRDVKNGDLLFFKTSKTSSKINHVGLVVSKSKNNIEFIHSTTSKGVITSLLSENYWKKAFVEARRVL